MSNFNFTALPQEEVMAIGNASIKFDVKSTLPADIRDRVEIVAWNGKEGFMEYNDRLRLLETFSNPSPYGLLIDAWLRAAAEQGLLLTQAKTIKRDFIETIYFHRRRSPYDSYLGWIWVATEDDLTAAMARVVPQIVGSDSTTGLIGAINSRITSFNAIDYSFWLYYPQADSFQWSYTGGAPVVVNLIDFPPWSQINFSGGSAGAQLQIYHYKPYAYAPGFGGWVETGRAGNTTSRSPANVGTVPLINTSEIVGPVVANIPWESINPTVKHMLTLEQASTLLQMISDRNQWYLDRKLERLAAIEPLTTIAAVIAYDVTAGW